MIAESSSSGVRPVSTGLAFSVFAGVVASAEGSDFVALETSGISEMVQENRRLMLWLLSFMKSWRAQTIKQNSSSRLTPVQLLLPLRLWALQQEGLVA